MSLTLWRCGRAAKSMCYTEGISRSKQANDSRWLLLRYWGDCQSILVKLSTWWCSCIYMVRKIAFTSSFVCKGPFWRTNSYIECPPNQKNRPSSSRNWWGLCTWKHFSTMNWVDWNGDLDNPNESEDDCEADNESDVDQDNAMENLESPEKRNVSAAPNVPGLIRPTCRSNRKTEKVLMTVNATEPRSNKGHKTK